MPDISNKQIAPTVVLASHGNKNACRELYIHYYKNMIPLFLQIVNNFTLHFVLFFCIIAFYCVYILFIFNF